MLWTAPRPARSALFLLALFVAVGSVAVPRDVADAAPLTCLTGTSPVVANDADQIRALQDDIASACPCESFDGTKGKKHGDYLKCANAAISAAVKAGELRSQCKGTVTKFHSQSTCGDLASANRVVCVKRNTSTGKVTCAIAKASQCVDKGATDAEACTDFSLCIDAADTDGNLLIAAPGDTGQCNALPPPPPVCGDGVVEGTEQCDGANLNGETCVTQGFQGGALACSSSCTFDVSACTSGGNLAVQVFTPSGLPVVGASVKVGTTTLTTDLGGAVQFTGLLAGRTVGQVNANGFAASTAVADVLVNATVTATVRLLPLGDPIDFDAESGAIVTRGSVVVTLPPGGFVDENGQPVTGEVQVTIAGLDPTTNQIALAPGPFQGIPTGSAVPVQFESLFMAEISLSQGGSPVHLAPGQTVTLDYTLPPALQGVFDDGDLIPAWHYDLTQGLWVQDGTGEIQTSFVDGLQHWIATVTHLTWWNADKPFTDKNCVRVTVLRSSDNSPIEGAIVYAYGVSYSGTSSVITDASGQACLDFKKGATIRIVVEHPDFPVQEPGTIEITGNDTLAACSGAGGPCFVLSDFGIPDAILMGGQSCVSGVVKRGDGSVVEGASVSAVRTGGTTSSSKTVLSDALGHFCVPAPAGAAVKVMASKSEAGSLFTAETQVTVGSTEAVCGGTDCTTVPDLVLTELVADSCVRGRVWSNGGVGAAGTNVYLFSTFPIFSVCSAGPNAWGTLVASTTTDADGNFCLAFPREPNDGFQVVRFVLATDCAQNKRSCGDPIVQGITAPDAACDELTCVDAGDVFLQDVTSSCGSDT